MDEAKLKNIAKLASIEIKETEQEKILNLLNQDINDVKSIDKVNTDGLEPLNNPYEIYLETHEDIVSDGEKQEELMKCAPNSMYNYYVVPKVIE